MIRKKYCKYFDNLAINLIYIKHFNFLISTQTLYIVYSLVVSTFLMFLLNVACKISSNAEDHSSLVAVTTIFHYGFVYSSSVVRNLFLQIVKTCHHNLIPFLFRFHLSLSPIRCVCYLSFFSQCRLQYCRFKWFVSVFLLFKIDFYFLVCTLSASSLMSCTLFFFSRRFFLHSCIKLIVFPLLVILQWTCVKKMLSLCLHHTLLNTARAFL